MVDPAEVHAERLSWEMGSWRSIGLSLREEFRNQARQSDVEFSAYRGDYHYIETATGKRKFERSIQLADGDGAGVTISFTDGKRAADYLRKEGGISQHGQVTIKRAFGSEDSGITDRPDPLCHFYVGLKPLPEALPDAIPLGARRLIGRDCDLFLLRRERGNETDELVYWLDRATSIPLRVECFGTESARSDDRPTWIWSAGSLEEVKGRHIPITYKSEHFIYPDHGRRQVRYRVDGSVEEINFDLTYPDSMFWPEITPNTVVNDLINNQFIPAAIPPSDTHAESAGEPIRATESDGFYPSLPAAGLAIGTTILVAGLFLRSRRR